MAANSTNDVSNVKGVSGGYGFSAALGTEVGTALDPFASLSGFDNMGFISDDGIEESLDSTTDEMTDMNGDVIFVTKSKETEKLVLTLVSLTKESMSEWYGHSNVDDTANDYMKIKHKTTIHDNRTYVFDLLLKDGRKWRKVAPNGQVTDVGSITYGAGDLAGREITIVCMPDSDGYRMYDYIEKGSTTTTTTGA